MGFGSASASLVNSGAAWLGPVCSAWLQGHIAGTEMCAHIPFQKGWGTTMRSEEWLANILQLVFPSTYAQLSTNPHYF